MWQADGLDHHPLERAALGAAAGLIGTFALQAMMAARAQAIPSSVPPLAGDPGALAVQKVKQKVLPFQARFRVPRKAEAAAGKSVHLSYGALFGLLYGLLRSHRPTPTQALLEGSVLGLLVWAIGYLGWLPATGLMPPVWRQHAAQAIGPTVDHALYGAVTATAYDLLRLAAD